MRVFTGDGEPEPGSQNDPQRALILLKTDEGEHGPAWKDAKIA
jgi:hypothetical protein